jgi:hypothetical protein
MCIDLWYQYTSLDPKEIVHPVYVRRFPGSIHTPLSKCNRAVEGLNKLNLPDIVWDIPLFHVQITKSPDTPLSMCFHSLGLTGSLYLEVTLSPFLHCQ